MDPPPEGASAPAIQLLDVLEILPVVELEGCFWGELSHVRESDQLFTDCPPDRSNFRLACQQSLKLANLLTSTVAYNCFQSPDSSEEQHDGSAAGQAEWRRAFEQHGDFLARLPRVCRLTLSQWRSEDELVLTLEQIGVSTQSRLTKLTLRGQQPSFAGIEAALRACPGLRELDVGEVYAPAGPLLLPLHGAQHLTKLVLDYVVIEPADDVAGGDPVLLSLAGMSCLRHLELGVENLHCSESLRHLTGLRGLRHCHITANGSDISLADVAGIFGAASQLTALVLHDVEPRWLPAAGRESWAALALLGALRGLKTLDLGKTFVVNDAAWAVMRHLSQLTRLCVGAMDVTESAPGHLPLLRHLHVGDACYSGHKGIMQPGTLLQMLLPLLPLSQLCDLSGAMMCDDDSDGLRLIISHTGCPGAASQAEAALTSAVQHLAAAPCLRLGTSVSLHGAGWGQDAVPGQEGVLPVVDVARILHALKEPLTACVLVALELVAVPWVMVQSAMPALRYLELSKCRLLCGEVASIVRGLNTLEKLRIVRCAGLGVEVCEWADVAAACSHPLLLIFRGEIGGEELPEGVVTECEAVQERMYGQQFITWSEEAVSEA